VIRDGHVSPRQISAMLTIIVLGKGLDSAVLILVHWGHGAAELLLLVAEGVMVGAVLLLLPLHKAADKNLMDVIVATFGKWVGAIVCGVLFAMLLVDIAINLEMDMQQIRSVFLPLTPTQVVLIVSLVATAIPAYYGIEVLGRSNMMMFVLLMGIALVLIPLTFEVIKSSNIPPLLGPGPITLLKEGVLHFGFFGEYLTVFMLRPYVRDYLAFRRAIITAILICVTVGTASLLDLQMVFPYPTDDHLFFPFVEVARILYFGRFVQHIEALFALTWLAVALARLSVLIYILSLMAATMSRATNFRRYVPLVAGCLYFGALMLPNLAVAIDIKDIWLEKRSMPLLATIIVATIITGHWKARRAKREGTQGQPPGTGTQQATPNRRAAQGSD